MTSSLIAVRHNFETGHRLPHLPGKCQSLHGHSWWVEVTVEAPGTPGIVVEFGPYKAALRGWIDEHLDHGLMLGHADPLAEILPAHGKVFEFGPDAGDWPTVENVARLLARIASELLVDVDHAPGAEVVEVRVSETHVNEAAWRRG